MVTLLVGVLLTVAVLGSDSPKGYDDTTDSGGIEGKWQLLEVEWKGEKTQLAFQVVITLRGRTLTYDSTHDLVQGNCRIDSTCKPLRVDWIPSAKGLTARTLKFIYQIDGDTLRVAFLWNGGLDVQRPRGFTDEGVYIAVFKRVNNP
jgi:uncharacterized protein (TIGR03067 family)